MKKHEISGGYFPYCQLCVHDGSCALKHHEYLGVSSEGEVAKAAYGGHEDFSWGFSAFQKGTRRAHCTGKIQVTDSLFTPLQCECATIICSQALSGYVCAKLVPTAEGLRMLNSSKDPVLREDYIAAQPY